MKNTKNKKDKKNRRSAPRSRKNDLKNFLMIFAAVLLYGVGVCFFFSPSGLTPGGLSGIAIALERFGFLPFG